MGLDVSSLSVIATLRIQGAIGIILLLLFECFRSQTEIYAPKLRSKPKRCPKQPPAGFCAWLAPLMSISDEDTLHCTGLDGFVFLRFLKLCTTMTLGCGVVALIVLLPIYKTSPGHEKGVVGIMLYTMANIAPGGDRLWAPFLCAYIFTFFFLYLLVSEYKNFVRLRQDFMRDGDPDLSTQQLYSVLVENIPPECRSSKKLQDLFEELFPDNVYTAKIAMKYGPIVKAENNRMAILTRLENYVAAYEASDRVENPIVKLRNGKVPMIGVCGNQSEEAIGFYTKELSISNKIVSSLKKQAKCIDCAAAGVKYEKPLDCAGEEQEDASDETAIHFTPKSLSGTGFVTFTSLRAQAAAYQVAVLSDKYPQLKAYPADAPQNIIWNNIFVRHDQIRYSLTVAHAVYYFGLIFWATIVSVVAAFSQLSNLEKFLPFLKQLDAESKALLEGQLPVIALVMLMALLPMIFKSVGTYVVKQKTATEINHEVTEWFYLYQLANVYLMLFAGSLLGAIGDILRKPFSVVNLLAAALPGVATFFINLLLTMTLGGVPMVLLRISPLAMFKLQVAISNPRKLTKRTLLDGPLAPVELPYSVEVPRMMYVLCIALLYMVIAPIVLFVAGLCFGAYYIVWKYHLCYVIVPQVESGGKLWYKLFKYAMTGLMMSTLTMVGYMGIKQGIAQTPLLIPLPIIVYVVWGQCKEKYEVISANAALSQAVSKDTSSGNGSSEQDARDFDEDFFLPPQIKRPAVVTPDPYRIDGIPLLNSKECLDIVYYEHPPDIDEETPGASTFEKADKEASMSPRSVKASSSKVYPEPDKKDMIA